MLIDHVSENKTADTVTVITAIQLLQPFQMAYWLPSSIWISHIVLHSFITKAYKDKKFKYHRVYMGL